MSASAPPSSGARQRALTVLGAVFSIVCLVALVGWAAQQEAPTLPSAPGPIAELCAAVAFYLAGCVVRAERWYELLRYNGAQPRRLDAYGLLAVSNAGNNILPARAGDALRVVMIVPRAKTDARTAIGTIVAERVLDVVVLVGLFVVLAYGVLGGHRRAVGGAPAVRGAARRRAARRHRDRRLGAASPRAPQARAGVAGADGRGDAAPALQPRPAAARADVRRVGAGVGRLVADGTRRRPRPRAAGGRLPDGPRVGLRARARAARATSARSTRRSRSACGRSAAPARRRCRTCCCCASS